MKSFVLAAGLLAASITSAAAQYYGPRDRGYYDQSRGCEVEAARVHRYRRDAVRHDGHVDLGEKRVLRNLQADLERCIGGGDRDRRRYRYRYH